MRVKVICMIVLVVTLMLAIAASAAVAQNNLVCSTCTTWDTSAPFAVDAPAGSVVSEVSIEVAEPSVPTAAPVEAQIPPCYGPFTSDSVVVGGCYAIEGIGTGSVTVTIVDDCLDIAHIEVCFTPVPVETAAVQADAYISPVSTLPSTGLLIALPAVGFGLVSAGTLFLKRRR